MGAEKLESNFDFSLPVEVGKTTFQDILSQIPPGIEVYRLDFSKTKVIDRSFYPLLHQLRTRLDKDNIKLQSFNLNKELRNQIQSDGVQRLFNLGADQKVPSKPHGKSIDVAFITPFINATIEILKVQANIESKSGKPRMKEKDEKSVGDIIGLISLVSNVFEGSISLVFRQDVFLAICESMLGESFTEINDEIEDAAGELLNIIYGVAKAELNDKKNYKLEKAIPTVIRGPGVQLKQTVGPTIILPFETPAGTFQIEIEAVNH